MNELFSPGLPYTCLLMLINLLSALPQSPLSLIPDPSAPAPPPSLLKGFSNVRECACMQLWFYCGPLLVMSLLPNFWWSEPHGFLCSRFFRACLMCKWALVFPFRDEEKLNRESSACRLWFTGIFHPWHMPVAPERLSHLLSHLTSHPHKMYDFTPNVSAKLRGLLHSCSLKEPEWTWSGNDSRLPSWYFS